MGSPAVNLQASSAAHGVAADSHSLDQLRQLANQDPSKAVKQVATQFEALFMQMVLKSMREATPKSGLLDSSEQQTYNGMLDEQLAQKIAAGGTGLAEVIARQLSRNLSTPTQSSGAVTAPVPTAGAAGAAPAAAPAQAAPAPALAPAPAVSPATPAAGAMLQSLQAAARLRGLR